LEEGIRTLEFGATVKVLDEYVEILKQELLFAMASEHKIESMMRIQEIITINIELDKTVHGRLKLIRIYYNYNSSNVVAVSAAAS